jgi:hypothetical protein
MLLKIIYLIKKNTKTYEKINVLGYVDILLRLFFKPYKFVDAENKLHLYLLEILFFKGITILSNYVEIDTSKVMQLSNKFYLDTCLTKDISFLIMFVQNLQPLYSNTNEEIYVGEFFKRMLIHKDENFKCIGLLVPKFENIPSYDEIYKILFDKLY